MKKNTAVRDNIIILSIVLVVCIFFAAGFRVEPPKVELKVEDSNDGLFQMMPRGENMSPFFAEQAARDRLDDPTLMSFPNLVHGFSSVRKGEGEPPEPELSVYNLKPLTADPVHVEREPLVSEFKTPDSDPAASFTKPEITSIEPAKAKGRFSRRIVWLDCVCPAVFGIARCVSLALRGGLFPRLFARFRRANLRKCRGIRT